MTDSIARLEKRAMTSKNNQRETSISFFEDYASVKETGVSCLNDRRYTNVEDKYQNGQVNRHAIRYHQWLDHFRYVHQHLKSLIRRLN